ncbi:RAD26-like SNF2 family DNA-dependent ATPase [Mycena belliarum]|uniref:RAD26-like SNF2 family DNA-dependent ATPase n=1 Tax=Mycena belliarum TaxID=1033014 RepID=A0AAD6TVC3_9AGAR|nr:RAD26-like SNF2 family DNA-dependent ATPase [Mycena belliae]
MAVEVKPKVSAYANRNSNSIAAPIEIDSDSDFVSGPVPTVVKEKRKTKRKSAKRQPEESEDSNVYDIDKSRKKKQKTKRGPRARRRATSDDNPLLEFFNNLDLHSDSSEDERRPMDDDPMEGPSYDAEDDGSGSEADDDSPAPVNTFAKFVNRLPPPPVPPPPVPSTGDTTEDDTDEAEVDPDATESDSDVPPEPAPTKPVLKTANKPVSKRAATPKSDSATESDSDVDDPVEATPAEVAPLSSPPTSSGRSRPGFPLSLDQCELGPMVLDAEQGIEVPGAINTYLREYQREGVRFFWERYKEGRGALLGDDMARRKTIQVIAFLSAIMKKTGFKTDRDRRHMHVSALQDGREWKRHKKLPPANATWPTCLIIAPSSVVGNWEREFRTWGYFEVGSYMGKPDERKTVLDEFKMGRLDVMLTSLDLARRDIEDLEDLSWSCVIVDEVHTVKNPASKTSKAYNSFECLRRIGLTGTAIQNSYDELWTILDWTNPGRVGDIRQWRGFVSNPLKLGQSATASDAQRLQAHKVSQILRDQVLPRFFLRRTKSIIAHQLPSKTDEVVFCPLTSVQIDVYKKILDMDEIKYALNRDELCECGSGSVVKKCCHPFDPATIFKFMSVLIKLSNHLGLILPSPSDTKEQTVRNRHWASLAFPDGDAPQWEIAQTKKKYCGKWGVLNGLMKSWKIDPTTKILIFTKTVKLLDMLAHHLKIEGYGFVRLDGNTKQLDRMPMIDKFHTDPGISVFLISTMAGGTGLNLTGANKVIIFDPNWNPAHDLQAMDRAFRFGQTRDVSVYRLLGAGSVEELIYARQVYKQQQMKIGYEASIQTRYFAGVQGDKSRQGELFGLANIFKLHEGGLSTKIAIEKAQLAELDWALASMDAPRSSSGKKKTGVDITEVETNLDKEYGDLKGLGSLLFDDGLPQASQEAAGAIKGMYTHQNADLLVSSKIEQERTKVAQKKQRKSRKSAPVDTSPPPSWPPRRGVRHRHRHRSPSPTHEQRLNKRMAALIGTGMISHPDEYTSFAKAFSGYSKEEREYTLKQLDDYREDSSDEGQHDKAVPMELEPEDIDM